MYEVSTPEDILQFLKRECTRLSVYLPASKLITARIKKWERHLDNVLNSLLLDEEDNRLRSTFWKETVELVLTDLYLPHNELFVALEKLYTRKTHCNVIREIVGEETDFKEEPQDDCHVCCDSIDEPLSCGHWIHIDCVVQTGNPNCPLCKRVITMSCENAVKMEQIKNNKKRQQEETERRELLNTYPNQDPRIELLNIVRDFPENENIINFNVALIDANIHLAQLILTTGNFPREQYIYLNDVISRGIQLPTRISNELRSIMTTLDNLITNPRYSLLG
jgi:hypothetical protein